MKKQIPLEQAAAEFCTACQVLPQIYRLPPEVGRKRLDEIQNALVFLHPAYVSSYNIKTGNSLGNFPLHCVWPLRTEEVLHVILYVHGGGWVMGNFHTHEKLVRELAVRTGSLVLFPEYSLAPEAKFPTALEQCYWLMTMLTDVAKQLKLRTRLDTLTVAGDSEGGNMAAALTLMSRYRKGPAIAKQLLFYPVTNAAFDTDSYEAFAEGYYLEREGMKWFWDQYTDSDLNRAHSIASPLRADEHQLKELPSALIITAEADVLRDEGEAYAKRLLEAGTDAAAVRLQGMVHDFVMLHSLDQTEGCRRAMDLAVGWINDKNLQEFFP